MESLHKVRGTLGVEELVVPSRGQISALMNFSAITGRMGEYAEGKKSANIEFLHPNIRKQIEGFESEYLAMDYDEMSRNKKGHIYTPQPELAKSLEVDAKAVKKNPFALAKEIDRAKIFNFIQEMDAAKPTAFSKWALNAIGISAFD